MTAELSKTYRPADVEPDINALWDEHRIWHAKVPHAAAKRGSTSEAAGHSPAAKPPFAIVIPPPNVTAALHLGHALNNTIQDILVRYHRMAGHPTLWMPGTDHAGIATQTVVDKRLQAQGEKSLKDYKLDEVEGKDGRSAFIQKVEAWKEEYEARITEQLKLMGCSCDWDRQRFTMDAVCASAVREAFFQLFKDGLIYRGKRLVNWDPVTQTALADDEVEMQDVDGNFYYMKYPLCDAQGEPTTVGSHTHVTVATTRPETMLGDTAVAVNPNDEPRAKLIGQFVKLPIVNRIIPIIGDDYVVIPDPESEDSKARMASGFLKVTPAHDTNDYEIGQRHNLKIINIMAPDASISKDHGWPPEEWPPEEWQGSMDNHAAAEQAPASEAAGTVSPFAHKLLGQSREDARKSIVRYFKDNDLLEEIKPYRHAVGHSYRSHKPIEPYYSDQWYVKVTDERLAGAALKAMSSEQWNKSDADMPGGEGELSFTPTRYAKTFQNWHEGIRDWCISRQLWWGHRIPVWEVKHRGTMSDPDAYRSDLDQALKQYFTAIDHQGEYCLMLGATTFQTYICCRTKEAGDALERLSEYLAADTFQFQRDEKSREITSKPIIGGPEVVSAATEVSKKVRNFTQDPDVLDTWFSSALWPMSTMGWPNPEAFKDATPDDSPAVPEGGALLNTFNPSSVLCTAREIITLWVSRMVMFNLYFTGQEKLPFKDVFIHAMIQDGFGQKMSKSLGNGVDPMDIIHSHGSDAMRYTLASMTTQTQDVRMPVDMVCPHTSKTFTPKFQTLSNGYKVPEPEQESPFAPGKKMVSSFGLATGTATPTDEIPAARNTSEKFDLGRNFANKLWNASRFVLAALSERPLGTGMAGGESRSLPSRWILSRAVRTIEEVNAALARYDFHGYANHVYDFVWRDLCDWYIESVKGVIYQDGRAGENARRVLATVLDVSLRLLHPSMPFVTERVWQSLCEIAPKRGVEGLDPTECDVLAIAPWPEADRATIDVAAERTFETLRDIVGMVREARASAKIPPKEMIEASLKIDEDLAQSASREIALVESLSQTKFVEVGPDVVKPESASVVTRPLVELYLHVAVDEEAESERLGKRRDELVKSVKQLKGRLSNKGYVDKAPAHLVQETRDQLVAAETELARLEEQLGS